MWRQVSITTLYIKDSEVIVKARWCAGYEAREAGKQSFQVNNGLADHGNLSMTADDHNVR